MAWNVYAGSWKQVIRTGRCGARGTRKKSCVKSTTTDPELATVWVAEIARDFTEGNMPFEVRRLGRTIGNWAQRIVVWHPAHVSNGSTEAINNLVKHVKRTAFGFRRFEPHYRIRALLYAGKPNWTLLDRLTPP